MADVTRGSAPGALPATPLDALQQALAAEHAAVWVLGFLAARVSQGEQPALAAQLADLFRAHRTARDALVSRIAARGADPVASEIDYSVDSPAQTPDQLRAVARRIEERVTRTYGAVVGGTAGRDRRLAVDALQAGAVRQLSLGARPTDLPGLT